VRFLIHCDRQAALRFAQIQGETAKQCLTPELREKVSSVVYWRATSNGPAQIKLRSEAVLWAVIDTRSAWAGLAQLARKLPCPWRDTIYDWIARNRKHFLKAQVCAMPKAAQEQRFLP
jgi:predicted DCC family thiol-disulfide oxidoreductase YuxK